MLVRITDLLFPTDDLTDNDTIAVATANFASPINIIRTAVAAAFKSS